MPIKDATPENGFINEWEIGMLESACEDPGSFIVNCILPCYNARDHRLALLGGDVESYVCFGGMCGEKVSNCTGKCTGKCPGACLCCESWCCPALAASGNRYMLQTTYQIQNSCMDNALICCANLCQLVVCILRCVGSPVDEEVENLVDCFFCIVLGCMETQHNVELKKRGINRNAPVPGQMTMPGMNNNQGGGYPPQQQGGYPPQQQGGYPPQQQGGYPPQQQGGYRS